MQASDSVRTKDEARAVCEDKDLMALGEKVLERIAKEGRRQPEPAE